MTEFMKFMEAFSTYRGEHPEVCQLSYPDSRGYGWRLGNKLVAEMDKHLDIEWPDAPADVQANFHKLFEYKSDLMGMPVVGRVDGELARGAYLLKITEYPVSAQMTDVDFKQAVKFDVGKRVTCPVSKAHFDWLCAVKLNSFEVNDGNCDYIDNFGAAYMGTLVNKKFDYGMIPHSEENGVAMFGNVNYQTGELWVSRSSDKNIELLDALLEYYAATQAGGGGDSGGGDAGGGDAGGGGGGDDGGGGAALPELGVEPVKDTSNLSIKCVRYGPPVKLLWSYTMSDDEKE